MTTACQGKYDCSMPDHQLSAALLKSLPTENLPSITEENEDDTLNSDKQLSSQATQTNLTSFMDSDVEVGCCGKKRKTNVKDYAPLKSKKVAKQKIKLTKAEKILLKKCKKVELKETESTDDTVSTSTLKDDEGDTRDNVSQIESEEEEEEEDEPRRFPEYTADQHACGECTNIPELEPEKQRVAFQADCCILADEPETDVVVQGIPLEPSAPYYSITNNKATTCTGPTPNPLLTNYNISTLVYKAPSASVDLKSTFMSFNLEAKEQNSSSNTGTTIDNTLPITCPDPVTSSSTSGQPQPPRFPQSDTQPPRSVPEPLKSGPEPPKNGPEPLRNRIDTQSPISDQEPPSPTNHTQQHRSVPEPLNSVLEPPRNDPVPPTRHTQPPRSDSQLTFTGSSCCTIRHSATSRNGGSSITISIVRGSGSPFPGGLVASSRKKPVKKICFLCNTSDCVHCKRSVKTRQRLRIVSKT